MDVVIPLQMAPDDGAELRYVLRSLKHIDHDRVWLSGWAPKWAQNVKVVRGPKQQNRYADSLANLMRVARHTDAPDQILFLADDIFAMRPDPPLGPWHRGQIHPKVLEYRLQPPNRIKRQAGHRHGLAQTCAVLQRMGHDGPLMNFELHLPALFDTAKLVEVVDLAQHTATVPALQPRSLYGNWWTPDAPEVGDVKIGDMHELPDADQHWVSTSDATFRSGQVGRFLRRLFPDPSPYEVV